MTYQELIDTYLAPLCQQAGGAFRVYALPVRTVDTALSHTDDLIAINRQSWVVELPDLDIVEGYEVYNDRMELLYNEAEDLGLTQQAWGTTERDVYVTFTTLVGDFFYVTYKIKDTEDEYRTLMLIKF